MSSRTGSRASGAFGLFGSFGARDGELASSREPFKFTLAAFSSSAREPRSGTAGGTLCIETKNYGNLNAHVDIRMRCLHRAHRYRPVHRIKHGWKGGQSYEFQSRYPRNTQMWLVASLDLVHSSPLSHPLQFPCPGTWVQIRQRHQTVVNRHLERARFDMIQKSWVSEWKKAVTTLAVKMPKRDA